MNKADEANNLGRLMAVLEKIYKDAGIKISATKLSLAPESPQAVLIPLMKTHREILNKLGHAGNKYGKLLMEIHEGLSDYPETLTLEEQVQFQIGYQKQSSVLTNRGRPVTLDVKKRGVLLHDDDVELAKELGKGNISAGLRIALSYIRKKQKE